MLQIEDTLIEAEGSLDQNGLIFFIEGVMDASAYIENSDWTKMKAENKWAEDQLLKRYDMVIFLESPEEQFFEREGNSTRTENYREALESDRKSEGSLEGPSKFADYCIIDKF